MKIAVTGPDGAGKSTLCRMLSERLDESQVIYAGKTEFQLLTTIYVKALWDRALDLSSALGFLVQHFLYYPFEYLENWWRIVLRYRNQVTIYDRHVFDRLVMKHSVRLRYQAGKIGRFSYLIQFGLNSFWSFIYRHFFPVIDYVIILLPDAELCYERARGQYKIITDAEIRVQSYLFAYEDVTADSRYYLLPVTKEDTLDDCLRTVLTYIEEE